MPYKHLYLLLCAALLFSCESGTPNKEDTNAQPASPIDLQAAIRCYEYLQKGDSITFKMIPQGDTISGMLIYKLAGKDQNKGTLLGIRKDSLLIANYNFVSEGKVSERQVAIKFEDHSVIFGYGDTYTEGNREQFKRPDSLHFDSTFRLNRITCP